MKELSNEDKAKRYDEALHKAKRIINVCVDDNTECRSMIACIQQIFPELKESEDDRIRKRLIAMCQHYIECYALDPYNLDGYKEALAWLEKQSKLSSENVNKI